MFRTNFAPSKLFSRFEFFIPAETVDVVGAACLSL